MEIGNRRGGNHDGGKSTGEIASEIDHRNRRREKSPEGENVGEVNRGADESTKQRCLKAYQSGASASDLAGRFGVSRRTISRWVRELSAGKPPKPVRRTHHGRVYTPLMTIDDPRYGEALKSIMDEKGLTFEDISRRSGISVSTVKRIASGARMGNFATWLALAKAVGCRIADIEDAVENG